MNRLIIRTMIVMGTVCSLAGPSFACTYPPDVWISDWVHYIGVNDSVTIEADEYSGTNIIGWYWSYDPSDGFSILDEDDWYGYYPSSSRTILFETTGEWQIWAEAENDDYLTDSDYARVYVLDVSIDDENSDEYMAYEGGEANIYYTILPSSGSFRYVVKLYIKDEGGSTIRTEDLTLQGLGAQHTTWDGKDDSEELVSPGQYTAEVELRVGYDPVLFSDSHSIAVYHLQVNSPLGTDRDVTFNDASPGVCSFTVTGTTGVAALNDAQHMGWGIPEIEGSQLTLDPPNGRGPAVDVTYTGLPASNSDFGITGIALYMSDGQNNIIAQVDLDMRLFFLPEARNHPVLAGEEDVYTNTPNWFYYWRKGRVVYSLADDGFLFEDSDTQGSYDPMQDELYVGRAAYGSDTQDRTFRNHFYQTCIRTPARGLWPAAYDYAMEDDDFLLAPLGGGEPDAVAIIPAQGETMLDTWPPYGDDEFTTVTIEDVEVECITTGDNGRLQTTRKGTDRMMVYTHPVDGDPDTIDEPDYDGGPNGGGKPWAVAITAGTNGYMESANDGSIMHPDEGGIGWLDWSDGTGWHYAGTWSDIDLVVRACGNAVTSRTLFYELWEAGATDEDGYNWDGVTRRSYPVVYPNVPGDLVEDASSVADSHFGHLYSKQQDTWDIATFDFPWADSWADHFFIWIALEIECKNAGLENYRDASADWSYEGRQWQVPF